MLKIAYDPIYSHPLPAGHRFPMEKYQLIPEQLLYEGTCSAENFFSPTLTFDLPSLETSILQAHSATYYQQLRQLELSPKMQRRIGFPLTSRLVERELLITQGTIDGCRWAMRYGIAMNVAGGTHHAYSDRGEGFCLLNDVATASHFLLSHGLAKRILICDLDVHQGNGTAEIFRNDDRVFTFSMHGAANYPLVKETSDLDIALPTNTEDGTYLRILSDTLPKIIREFVPDFMFYIAGVDILKTDKLGKLAVSREGCRRRDSFVLETAVAENLPVVVTMGGGYSPRLAEIVDAHCQTFRLAAELCYERQASIR